MRIASDRPIEDDKARLTWLKKWLGENRAIQAIAQKIVRYKVFSEREKKTKRTIDLHNTEGIEDAQSFESSFGYKDDLAELNCAIKYLNQIKSGFPTASESKVLYERSLEILANMFSKHGDLEFWY